MKKIEINISFLGLLNNAEHDYLHRTITGSLAESAAGIAFLAPAVTTYTTGYGHEDILFKLTQRMPETRSLEEYDELRDTDFIDFKMLIELGTRSRTPAVKAAAEKISFAIDRYKDAYRKAYGENTDLIINMLQDLSTEENVAALETLQATDLIASLQRNNNTFDELYRERSIRMHEMSDEGKLTLARRTVDESLVDLAEQTNALYLTTKMIGTDTDLIGKLERIITEIMAYIDQAERVYYLRVKRAKPKKDPEPVKPDPVDPPQEVYDFRVAEQRINRADCMEIIDTYPESFAERMEGRMEGSRLVIRKNSQDFYFDFQGYTRNEAEEIIGFTVNPPEGLPFMDPFSGAPADEAFVLIENVIIIQLEGAQLPDFID